MFATDHAVPPAERAREMEARGVESVWLPLRHRCAAVAAKVA